MKYILTIIKIEKNENYEAEMAKYKENTRYGNSSDQFRNTASPIPELEKSMRSLEVILTEEEYKKVKEEVIKVFK